MKTLLQISNDLNNLENKLGFNPNKIEQGSDEWKKMKLGVISASNISKVLAKKGSATRQTYMSELVAQVATGLFPEINARPLEWGKDHELAARSIYEFETGKVFNEVPFIFKDMSLRTGCSPDGYTDEYGLELKCPYTSKTFIEFATLGIIKKEYIDQCQYSMWVTGHDRWDFACYDPRMTTKQFHCVTLERDEKVMLRLDQSVPEFIQDMDDMLRTLGIEFGHQWKVKSEKAA